MHPPLSPSHGTEAATANSDVLLVAAVLRRDRKATAEFVSQHADAIYSYVRRRLLPRDDLVEDIVQDVFLAALAALAQYKGESKLRGWLLGIARHKVQDHYRLRLQDAAEDLEDVEAAIEAPFDDWIEQGQSQERVRETLTALPEHYRSVLLWRYWERVSVADMAARCGKTEKSIERMLARARGQFRRRWYGR